MEENQQNVMIANTDSYVIQQGKRVEKPWGYESWFAHNAKYVGKILFVKQGERLSLQYHAVKDETLTVIDGLARIFVGKESFTLGIGGKSIRILPNCVHRIEALTDVTLVEVSTPEVEDVIRVEDDYNRC